MPRLHILYPSSFRQYASLPVRFFKNRELDHILNSDPTLDMNDESFLEFLDTLIQIALRIVETALAWCGGKMMDPTISCTMYLTFAALILSMFWVMREIVRVNCEVAALQEEVAHMREAIVDSGENASNINLRHWYQGFANRLAGVLYMNS
jgi:hypothetical protein